MHTKLFKKVNKKVSKKYKKFKVYYLSSAKIYYINKEISKYKCRLMQNKITIFFICFDLHHKNTNQLNKLQQQKFTETHHRKKNSKYIFSHIY